MQGEDEDDDEDNEAMSMPKWPRVRQSNGSKPTLAESSFLMSTLSNYDHLKVL